MKLYLTTNTEVDTSEFSKFHIEPTINKTTDTLRAVRNPYFGTNWGDFNQVRSYAPKSGYDARCFISDKASYKAAGIENMGNYDLVDKDGILDFYGYINKTLDNRAVANGFKTNTAWLVVHELSHGLLQKAGLDEISSTNIVHEAEVNGALQELYFKYYNELLKTKVSLLKKFIELFIKIKQPGLQPLVAIKVDKVIATMAMMGHPVRVTDGYRSFERQDELYAQGRTTPGIKVTNARGGESFHNYGCAVDFVFVKEGYGASKELWETLGQVGKSQGFSWGGDWKKFPDRPHFELTLGYSLEDFKEGRVDYEKFQ